MDGKVSLSKMNHTQYFITLSINFAGEDMYEYSYTVAIF